MSRYALATRTPDLSHMRGSLACLICQLTHRARSDIVSCIRQMQPRAYAKPVYLLLAAGSAFVRLLAAPSTPFKLQAAVQ